LVYLQRQLLVEFLNLDLDDRSQTENIGGELHMIIHRDLNSPSFGTLRALKAELIEILSPITLIPDGGMKKGKLLAHLQMLIKKLNLLRLELRFILLSGNKKLELCGIKIPNPTRQLLNREQGIFSLGSEWIVKTDFSAGIAYSPRRDFYGMIAEGLLTGELAKLRRCPCCRVFFTTTDPRRKYLPQHTRIYHDKLHGSERVRAWREKSS